MVRKGDGENRSHRRGTLRFGLEERRIPTRTTGEGENPKTGWGSLEEQKLRKAEFERRYTPPPPQLLADAARNHPEQHS